MAKQKSSGIRMRYAVERVWFLDPTAMDYGVAVEAAAKAFDVNAIELLSAAVARRKDEVALELHQEEAERLVRGDILVCCPNCGYEFTPTEAS